MKAAGIICECNPFHSGHAHLIAEARRLSGADFIVAVMSGDFVQRGEPAIFDKYTRTRQVLQGGADMVFELPVRFCLSSAGDFAMGSVLAMACLGVVTDLFFGSECGELAPLMEAAAILSEETSTGFSKHLQDSLRNGLSFPAARAQALTLTGSVEKSILEQPNNILGIEYCRALLTLDVPIKPNTIPRIGQDYHGNERQKKCSHPAASALRRQIYLSKTPHLTLNDCSGTIGYALLKEKNLEKYKDVSPELAAHIRKYTDDYVTAAEFTRDCQTRAFTESRIRRALLQIALELTDTEMTMPYLRLLGMKKEAGKLLKEAQETGPFSTKILTKLSSDINHLDDAAAKLLEKDILASDWYRQMWRRKYQEKMPNEFQRPPAGQPWNT